MTDFGVKLPQNHAKQAENIEKAKERARQIARDEMEDKRRREQRVIDPEEVKRRLLNR